ncbi:MAG: hypothetical protein ACRENP_14960 [Longimicrobiales bacterium]
MQHPLTDSIFAFSATEGRTLVVLVSLSCRICIDEAHAIVAIVRAFPAQQRVIMLRENIHKLEVLPAAYRAVADQIFNPLNPVAPPLSSTPAFIVVERGEAEVVWVGIPGWVQRVRAYSKYTRGT